MILLGSRLFLCVLAFDLICAALTLAAPSQTCPDPSKTCPASATSSSKPKQSWLSRLLFSTPGAVREDDELRSGIAHFYDETTSIWLDVWGDHLHHGYYESESVNNHRIPQELMIDNAISWAYNSDKNKGMVNSFIDIGCGVGGSSRHTINNTFTTVKEAVGLSLSPFQISLAQKLTEEAKLSHILRFEVADALQLPHPDNTFDLAWSMESGEHMPNKARFVSEIARVLRPGGRLIIVTWCHRELAPNEQLTSEEQQLLDNINDAYYLPTWVAGSHYVSLLQELGLSDVRMADWSDKVKPFWPAVIRTALYPWNLWRLIKGGTLMMKAALASVWMRKGLSNGTIRFVILTATKQQ